MRITKEDIREAKEYISEVWHEAGDRVISATERVEKFSGNLTDFCKRTGCTCDVYEDTVLDGLRQLFPGVWEEIPTNTKKTGFLCLMYTLVLCGVDISH